mmetsp:Transcript_46519/g.99590  ORF Transcript_46519/g.99590 Transcript_46519/m.99590 type:complete len:365 (+) Transcript_46519:136-1230(+)
MGTSSLIISQQRGQALAWIAGWCCWAWCWLSGDALSVSRLHFDAQGQLLAHGDSAFFLAPEWFFDPSPPSPEDFAEGSYASAFSAANGSTCHPQCAWSCTKPSCDRHCKPICKAPICETACSAPKLSQCKEVCDQEPVCTVVCPRNQSTRPASLLATSESESESESSALSESACPSKNCPGCTTHCTQAACRLNCTTGDNCQTKCGEPACDWECEDGICAKPDCRMACTAPKFCSLAPDPLGHRDDLQGKGPNVLQGHSGLGAEYAGRSVPWKGLAKVQNDTLVGGVPPGTAPLKPISPLKPAGALPIGGALPMVPGQDCDAPCEKDEQGICRCGTQEEAEVHPVIRWVVPQMMQPPLPPPAGQ